MSWDVLLTGLALALLVALVGVALLFAPSRGKRAALAIIAVAVLVAVAVRGG